MACTSPQDVEVRKGPWTIEEDLILINYIANHGEGVWNSVAKAAGLKRTGKSCRLRWLNYLRPDVRRGNITADEQLLIMELHAKWGNRWSKIAKHLPGRTDNEIKNYWRTRIQKHIKQADQMWSSQSNISEHEKASTSQVDQPCNTSYMPCCFTTTITNATEESFMEAYSPSSFDHHHCNNMDTSNPTAADASMSMAFESNASYWSVEDLWPMHLFNDN